MIFQRHTLAPLAAAVFGLVLAAGYLEVHFLPAHSLFSDSFTSAAHVNPLSWAAASSEIIAALMLAMLGGLIIRASGGVRALAATNVQFQRARAILRHPVVLTMGVTQAAVLILSFVQVYG